MYNYSNKHTLAFGALFQNLSYGLEDNLYIPSPTYIWIINNVHNDLIKHKMTVSILYIIYKYISPEDNIYM